LAVFAGNFVLFINVIILPGFPVVAVYMPNPGVFHRLFESPIFYVEPISCAKPSLNRLCPESLKKQRYDVVAG
jgi:hypothetical protein